MPPLQALLSQWAAIIARGVEQHLDQPVNSPIRQAEPGIWQAKMHGDGRTDAPTIQRLTFNSCRLHGILFKSQSGSSQALVKIQIGDPS